jgi:hypothetical protein
MPWGPADAGRFTKKARGHPKAARAFSHAANSVLESTGDEGRAVRAGNAAAAHSVEKSNEHGTPGRRYGGGHRH